VAADQENLDGPGRTIAKHDESGSRDRRHRRRFDGHEVVCHDDRAAVIRFAEARVDER
jgi:hypothetical protein